MKLDHAHELPLSASEAELLLELIVKEVLTEGHDEVLLSEGFITMPPQCFKNASTYGD